MVRFSQTLSMKLSKEDRELLERQADEQRLPLSTYVRLRVLGGIVKSE